VGAQVRRFMTMHKRAVTPCALSLPGMRGGNAQIGRLATGSASMENTRNPDDAHVTGGAEVRSRRRARSAPQLTWLARRYRRHVRRGGGDRAAPTATATRWALLPARGSKELTLLLPLPKDPPRSLHWHRVAWAAASRGQGMHAGTVMKREIPPSLRSNRPQVPLA
jgi:hypothetical protein